MQQVVEIEKGGVALVIQVHIPEHFELVDETLERERA